VDTERITRREPGRTTRHHVVDERYAEILFSDFPKLSRIGILDALADFPQRGAIEIAAWASKTREPRKALRAWAAKNRPRRTRHGTCSGCSGVFRRRDLIELGEDNHDNLTHFHGDRLCGECADNAGVVL